MISRTDAERLATELPGYHPMPAYAAALPFYDCSLDIRLMAKQSLSAIEVAVLRCLAEGMDTPEALNLVLGIGPELLADALDNLLSADLTDPAADADGATRFVLNDRGTTAAAEACFYKPEVVRFRMMFDALTGELHPTNRLRFVNETDVRNAEMHALPHHLAAPGPADLDPGDVADVLAETRRHEPKRVPDGTLYDMLAVVSVSRVYLPCDVIAFDAPDQSHVEFRVLERGVRRVDHEKQIGAMFARYQERILPLVRETEIAAPAIQIEPLLQRADAAQAAVEELSSALGALREQVRTAASEADAAPVVSDTRKQLESLMAETERIRGELEEAKRERDSVRRIDMREHRTILLDGLRNAVSRVIIVSPWIQPVAVNDEFRAALAKALRRGAHVIIGWGYPEELNEYKREQTLHSIRQMQREAENAPRGRLDVVEHGSTHEKVLIVDREFMVVTSFNWLSFRGQWGQRAEAGIYHRIRDEIEAAAAIYLDRLGVAPERSGREVSAGQRERLQRSGIRVRDGNRDTGRRRR